MDHLLNIDLAQRMANLNVLILDAQSCAATARDILAGKSDSGLFSHNVEGDQYFARLLFSLPRRISRDSWRR